MTIELSTITNTLTVRTPRALTLAGQAANTVAARQVFTDYRERKAANTLRRQDAGLALFTDFLATVGVKAGNLAKDPQAWRGITWGLVAGFVRWQLRQGYTVSTVNVRLTSMADLSPRTLALYRQSGSSWRSTTPCSKAWTPASPTRRGLIRRPSGPSAPSADRLRNPWQSVHSVAIRVLFHY